MAEKNVSAGFRVLQAPKAGQNTQQLIQQYYNLIYKVFFFFFLRVCLSNPTSPPWSFHRFG